MLHQISFVWLLVAMMQVFLITLSKMLINLPATIFEPFFKRSISICRQILWCHIPLVLSYIDIYFSFKKIYISCERKFVIQIQRNVLQIKLNHLISNPTIECSISERNLPQASCELLCFLTMQLPTCMSLKLK